MQINRLELALNNCPNNLIIFDSFVKTDATVPNYKKVLAAVSGGSDSDIVNSICYSGYGMSRTGCAGCPFAKDYEKELRIIQKHEPKLYKAVLNVFGDSYEYTRKYKEYVRKNTTSNRITLFDFM